jgi:hypothetical protein
MMALSGRQKEKRTLPGAFADVSRFVCVATFPELFEGSVPFFIAPSVEERRNKEKRLCFLVLVREF